MNESQFQLSPEPAPRTPFTRRSGRAAQKAGKSFQEVIAFSAALQKSVVTLEELPSLGLKFVAGGRQIKTRICIDFIGTLNDYSGFFFDAKSCGAGVTGFDANFWHKKQDHQAKFLRRMSKGGAVAGLLVRSIEQGLYLFGDIKDMDVLETIRFAREGKLCRQWVECGRVGGEVDFVKIRRAYFADLERPNV